MAIEVVLSPDAQQQYKTCIDYVKYVLFQKKAAQNIANSFKKFLENVKEFPEMYPIMQEECLRQKKVRRALVENYVVVYEYDGSAVTVLGFFHQTQDYARFF